MMYTEDLPYFLCLKRNEKLFQYLFPFSHSTICSKVVSPVTNVTISFSDGASTNPTDSPLAGQPYI